MADGYRNFLPCLALMGLPHPLKQVMNKITRRNDVVWTALASPTDPYASPQCNTTLDGFRVDGSIHCAAGENQAMSIPHAPGKKDV
jgi:hypothetical protein